MSLKIPSNLVVGFNHRSDTFTGKLAFINYYRVDGSIAQPTNFTNWISANIPKEEHDNVPLTGYIINKGIQRSHSFGSGSANIRMFDPRGFEFEITLNNFIELTQYSDITAQEIKQECILAWNGNQIYLLPTNSGTYSDYLALTQDNKAQVFDGKKEQLIVGARYASKSLSDLIYIGNLPFNDSYAKKLSKKHIFFSLSERKFKPIGKTTICEVLNLAKYEETDNLIAYYQTLHDMTNTPSSFRIVTHDFKETLRQDIQTKFEEIRLNTSLQASCLNNPSTVFYYLTNTFSTFHINHNNNNILLSSIFRNDRHPISELQQEVASLYKANLPVNEILTFLYKLLDTYELTIPVKPFTENSVMISTYKDSPNILYMTIPETSLEEGALSMKDVIPLSAVI